MENLMLAALLVGMRHHGLLEAGEQNNKLNKHQRKHLLLAYNQKKPAGAAFFLHQH